MYRLPWTLIILSLSKKMKLTFRFPSLPLPKVNYINYYISNV